MKYAEIVETLNANPEANVIELMRLIGMEPYTQLSNGDWTGCDFSGCDLSGFDCTNAQFDDADFTNANVKGADFRGSTFTESIVKAVNLNGATFGGRQNAMINRWIKSQFRPEAGAMDATAYLEKIRKEKRHGSAKAIVHEMNRAGLGPNKYAYSMLVSKVAGEGKEILARTDFDEFVSLGGEPDPALWNSLLRKMHLYSSACDVFGEMIAKGFKPDPYTINIMIEHAPDRSQAEMWLNRKAEFGLPLDRVGFNSIIGKAASASESLKIIADMIAANVTPEKLDYDVALQNAQSDEEVRSIISIMEERGEWPDDKTYNRAINRSSSFEIAKKYLFVMIDRGYRPDPHTSKALSSSASSFSELYEAFALLNRHGVEYERDLEHNPFGMCTEWLRNKHNLPADEISDIWREANILQNEGATFIEILRWFADTFLIGEEQEMALSFLN